ncbi:hypothetical protein GIB67_028955 [Kingdonia uniflora]|uniref:Uncharacterized protein n=1 Tax=Kingdonia uniflora TaxID=39325 RepID=A0A7J7LC85_9MAGN|nr:hypothetical protein GIB67_028955 [Kingdonia uniflora]
MLTNVPQSNEHFQTIPTNVPLSNEPSIPQSSIHLSNEPVLTNVPPSNKPMLTNVPFSIEPEPIIGQTKTSAEFQFEPQPELVKVLLDFRFKSAAYTEDPNDFSKEFNISHLYRDRIELKNHIRAYAVVNKFNLEHVLSNEYKIVVRCKEMSYTYREEAEKSQDRLTPWATDHCESKKFVADSLICRVRTSRHHFQMTSYGITDLVNIEDGTCSCRWWQMMGIPFVNTEYAL